MTPDELQSLVHCKAWVDRQIVDTVDGIESTIGSLRPRVFDELVAGFECPAMSTGTANFRDICDYRRERVAALSAARVPACESLGLLERFALPSRRDLMVRFPSMCDVESRSFRASSGFFDDEDLPPSGTWALLFDRTDVVGFSQYAFEWGADISAFCLLTYVPDRLRELASRGIQDNLCGSVMWLDQWCGERPNSILARAVRVARL